MSCAICNEDQLPEVHSEISRKVADITFEMQLPAKRCSACGEESFGIDDLHRFSLAITSWLVENGVRTPAAFRHLRKSIGMPANKLAELLGVTSETISRWENGKKTLPHYAFGLLVMLIRDELSGGQGGVQTTLEMLLRKADDERPPEVRLTA